MALSKAFDNVHRRMLLNKLMIHEKSLKWVKPYLENKVHYVEITDGERLLQKSEILTKN